MISGILAFSFLVTITILKALPKKVILSSNRLLGEKGVKIFIGIEFGHLLKAGHLCFTKLNKS